MQPVFDPSKLRLGVADQLGDIPVAPSTAVPAGSTGDSADPAYRAKATQAAVKFESFFIGHMLHQMRSSTKELASEDSVFRDRINDDMLDMADNLVADRMAGQRAFGIADVILRQLLPPAPANPAAAATQLPSSNAEPNNLAPPLNPSP
jgi:flagellar protein FlgJ